MNPFDFVNAINLNKKDLIRGSESPDLIEKAYVPYMTNKALSYFADTIMYSNEMNINNNIDNLLQNDYYLNSIRVSKRFSKWSKREEDLEVDCVQQYYNVSYTKAVEILKVLSEQQLNLIKIRITKGGNHVQFESTGGGYSKES